MLLAALGAASRGGEHGPRFLFPLLLLLLVGLLVGKVVRHRRGGAYGHRHGYRPSSPIATLEDRFARGEIDRAEFDHRKAVLDGADHVPPAPEPSSPVPPTSGPTEPAADTSEATESDEVADPDGEDDE